MAGAATIVIGAALLMGGEGPPNASRPGMDPVSVGRDTISTEFVPAHVVPFLREGRYWRAARELRSYLDAISDPPPQAILTAARAEAEWGGWSAVRSYLEGRAWLDAVSGGEGWYWLARAHDQVSQDRDALAAYERYLLHADRSTDRAIIAELRRGLVLLRMGQRERGAEALISVRERAPYIADWMAIRSAEALAESGDTAAVRNLLQELPSSAGMRQRGRLALISAFENVGDRAGALEAANGMRDQATTAGQRAQLTAAVGRLALDQGNRELARRELNAAMAMAPGSAAARESALMLSGFGALTSAEHLTVARIFDRHGNARRAAEGYRAVLAAGAESSARENEIRLALGQALFNTGEYAESVLILRTLQNAEAPLARPALLTAGRAEYRRGNREEAFAIFRELARRYPGSVEGSEGLFLVADLNHDDGALGTAASIYRDVATNFAGTDRAGLALMRLAGMHYLDRDFAGAAAVWEEYRSSYPTGQRWLQASYWAGRAYEAVAERELAAERYRATRDRDPLSYYALLATKRLGLPYWPISVSESPTVDPVAEARVAEWMRAVDLLREAGLHSDADAEAQRLAERTGENIQLQYSLAEALNERGYAIRGIRIGQRIESGSTELNLRLLRILYPLPYRELLEAEAREKQLDPFIVAALTRQESLFTARISSPAGARGLMQIMPETGSALARGAGIEGWNAELLYEPEINVHLGTLYLAEQMERYDGSLPSVFSAYNAGPHRINAWRNFPEYGDEELFTERIPYRETRDYVKILTRNIAVYRGLYGG